MSATTGEQKRKEEETVNLDRLVVPIKENARSSSLSKHEREAARASAFKSFMSRPLLHIRDTKQVLLIGMVGLPARGKSYMANKLTRYLTWLGYRVQGFNLGKYRRGLIGAQQPSQFFDSSNTEGSTFRHDVANKALSDIREFFDNGGQAAILDATNSTKQRRKLVSEFLKSLSIAHELIWVESICNDASLIETNIASTKLHSPDYEGKTQQEAIADFKQRIEYYAKSYQTLDDEECGPDDSYIKLFDTGQKMITYQIKGYLPSRIVFFLMNLQPKNRPIWFTRHGESEFNAAQKIGGDSDLTKRGQEYARRLGEFMQEQPEISSNPQNLAIWHSTLKRTIETAEHVYKTVKTPGLDTQTVVKWRALTEINAGVFEGLTYDEIKVIDPDGFAARAKDKLNYKYPQGESYKDVIDRVERVIFELERTQRAVLVIAHQAVVRCLYGYFLDLPLDQVPMVDIPLHTVIKLTPYAYGCKEERFLLMHDETDGPIPKDTLYVPPLVRQPSSAVSSPLPPPHHPTAAQANGHSHTADLATSKTGSTANLNILLPAAAGAGAGAGAGTSKSAPPAPGAAAGAGSPGSTVSTPSPPTFLPVSPSLNMISTAPTTGVKGVKKKPTADHAVEEVLYV